MFTGFARVYQVYCEEDIVSARFFCRKTLIQSYASQEEDSCALLGSPQYILVPGPGQHFLPRAINPTKSLWCRMSQVAGQNSSRSTLLDRAHSPSGGGGRSSWLPSRSRHHSSIPSGHPTIAQVSRCCSGIWTRYVWSMKSCAIFEIWLNDP